MINCLARAESVPHFLPHFHFSALIFAPYRVHVIGIKCTVYHTLCSQFSTTDSNFLGSSPTGHPTKKSADALHRRICFMRWVPSGTRTARHCRRQGNQQPGGLLISARVPTSRNVYQGKCCADALHRRIFYLAGYPVGLEQQRRRPRPTAKDFPRPGEDVSRRQKGEYREELLGQRSDFSRPR